MESLIGFATTEVHRWDTEAHRLLDGREHGQFEAHPLDTFRLSAEYGMTSDRLRYLLETPARIEREKERKRLDAEAAAERKRAALEVYLTRMDEPARTRAVVWASSPVRARTLQQAGGVWPPFLGLPTHLPGPTLIRLPIPTEEWQTRLWNKHIRGKAHGTRVHLWKLKLDLEQMHPDIRVGEAAAANWIGQLIDRGLMERKIHSSWARKSYSWHVVNDIQQRGRADAERATTDAERVAREAAAAARDQDRLRASEGAAVDDATYEAWFQGVTLIPFRRWAGPIANHMNVTASGTPACPACTGAMNDADSLRLGYRARCAPEIEAKYQITVAIRRP